MEPTFGNLLIELHIDGIPRPKARPRVGRGGRFYTPRDVDGWKEGIEVLALAEFGEEPYEKAVGIEMYFQFPRPKSRSKYSLMDTRPDGDNLEKAVLDALNGIVYLDDKQVIHCAWGKTYGEVGHTRVRVFQALGLAAQ